MRISDLVLTILDNDMKLRTKNNYENCRRGEHGLYLHAC